MSTTARTQHERFVAADHARTQWILGNPEIRRHEAALAGEMTLGAGPVLEVGAGEGLTLQFRPELLAHGYVGTDLHVDRARAVRASGDGGAAVVAACSVTSLPFAAGTFGTVWCRDVLHHLTPTQRQDALAEMARVLKDDGVLCLMEPNAGRAPVPALFSAIIPTERMALSFDAGLLRALAEPRFHNVAVRHVEPSMLYRMVLHHRFGLPWLAGVRGVARGLRAWEAIAGLFPTSRWCYVVLRCRQPRR